MADTFLAHDVDDRRWEAAGEAAGEVAGEVAGGEGEDAAAAAAADEGPVVPGAESTRAASVSAAAVDIVLEVVVGGEVVDRLWESGLDGEATHRGVFRLTMLMGQSSDGVAWCQVAPGPCWVALYT